MKHKLLFTILGVFLIWRSILFFVGSQADTLVQYKPSFPYFDELLPRYGAPRWVYSWANFDGVHYITIAEKGYIGTGLIQAFFPLFPYVFLHSLAVVGHVNTLITGLILSNIFTAMLFCTWFFFVKEAYNQKVAWIALLLLVTFPTAFFFGALYTESLFLLLVLLSFMAAKRKNWPVVSLLVMMATATRIVGVFLIPALLYEYWSSTRSKKIDPVPVLWIMAGSLGLLFYMVFLYSEFKDPLYFLHVQSQFGAGRQDSLITYPQVLWRSLKILLTARPFDWKYFAYVQEFLVGTAGVLGLIWSAKRVKTSYLIFAAGAFLLPTLTGTFSSMPRYVLVCFPIFLILAKFFESRKILLSLWLIASTILLMISLILFIQGYWVA